MMNFANNIDVYQIWADMVKYDRGFFDENQRPYCCVYAGRRDIHTYKHTHEEIMEKYKDNLFSVAFNVCKNAADADDIVQETLIQYHTSNKQFDSEQHIRAWLIRVAINKAKNINMSFWRRASVPLEDYIEVLAFETPEAKNLFEEVMKLPEKYRIAIHLFYYEDCTIKEIAGILKTSESNVKVRLTRGRKLLKQDLQEEWNDDDE